MQTVTTFWLKWTQDKCQYYAIYFEKECTGLSSWCKYVHLCIERKAKEDWLLRARMKRSLWFLTMGGEEGFGRRAPLYGSWESKCLNRLWKGDLLTSDRRIHWESRDTQQCLCCKKDCLESLEHLIMDCDTLKDEQINILGERIHNDAWSISDLNNIYES